MDTLSIIAGIVALASLVGLAFMSGHEYGRGQGISTERDLANRRVNALLTAENKRKPRARRTRK